MQTKHISACLMGNSGASNPRKDSTPYDLFTSSSTFSWSGRCRVYPGNTGNEIRIHPGWDPMQTFIPRDNLQETNQCVFQRLGGNQRTLRNPTLKWEEHAQKLKDPEVVRQRRNLLCHHTTLRYIRALSLQITVQNNSEFRSGLCHIIPSVS